MEKLKRWMNSRRYNSHLMRLIVCSYIAYLGGKITVNQYQDGTFSLTLSFCAILLIVLAVPVALISLYAVLNGYSVEYKGKTNSSDFSQAQDELSESKALEE